MKFLLPIILTIVFGCNNNSSVEDNQIIVDFTPNKSPHFKKIVIMPQHVVTKDTFKLGEIFEAKIFLNENIEMLKKIADYREFEYELEFDADVTTRNKSLIVFHEPNEDTARIKFEVFALDTTNEFQEINWLYSIKFKFIDNQKTIYDTTFMRSDKYVVQR